MAKNPGRRFGLILCERWPQYVLEVTAICFGIMLSFGLNEWREARKERIMEIAALETIRDLKN